jgi:hypothetical protein
MGIIYCWKLGDQVVYIGRTIYYETNLNEKVIF